jgi:hypothetical protein
VNLTEELLLAFEGFDGAHGQTEVSNQRMNGKQKAKSFIVRNPLTLELMQGHIDGIKGVGAIPINAENKCKFGALDIDEYPLDHNALVDKLTKLKVPCIVCRSKSGGAHIFFFFTEWMEAADFRDKAAEIAAALGHGRCEIFPKQEQVLVERGDVGNFINLPYFDSEQTLRFAVIKVGKDYIEATLPQFIEQVHKIKCDPKKFMELSVGGKPNLFPGYVPCLKSLLSMGIFEGGRNKAAFQLGVFLQKSSPNDWKMQLEQLNVKHFTPPLPASEIVTVQSTLEKKEYQYLCKEEPMSSHCNQSVCRGLKHGIGATSMPAISGLSVILSEPRLWFLDIDGRRLELTTEELQAPRLFQRACMEQLNFMPPKMKDADWEVQVNGLLENCNEIAVPQELTYKGQFLSYLELFCTGRVQAQSFEEVVIGKPYTDVEDARTFFKLDALMEFLRNRKFDNYTRAQVQERLKEINNGDSSLVKKFQNSQGKWKSVRVWWIPEFGGEVEIKPITIEEEEVPF